MDIEQLITSIDRLKNKDNELEQKIDSKKRALDTINVEISKEKQRLEEIVKELAKSVETKLKESEKIDNDLSVQSSVLARMQKARNIKLEAVQNMSRGAVNNIVRENLRQNTLEDEIANINGNDSKDNSLGDFLKIQFEKEFNIKYPSSEERYLGERSFNQVISILKERMFHSKEPDKIVDRYLETYPQSINEEQTQQLQELKSQFNRL